MPPTSRPAARAFRALHESPKGFIMPNAWDAGSAILLAAEGFAAIGTTSAGIAFSLGKQDYRVDHPHSSVSRAEMFARMAEIVAAAGIPVNGDLEAGFGDAPQAVAETIAMAVEAGLAGGNIEDKKPLEHALYDEALAVERIAAAREAAGKDRFVLTARTDVLLQGGTIESAIRRANLFLKAGADCTFVPGPSDAKTVARLVKEIEGPLNVVIGLDSNKANAHDLIAAGVQRISLGGAIARAALGFVRRSARELRDHGTLNFAEGQLAAGELNAAFAKRPTR
ncbi:MAG: isocitrate lyase/phosphoenolpyruvate mutase family protein [Alphaproteobacteria bacterium]|nr:isocitrate lyase/phosphoenolpyruvate mutase family protein [Alphaproteobacteria bacterium]